MPQQAKAGIVDTTALLAKDLLALGIFERMEYLALTLIAQSKGVFGKAKSIDFNEILSNCKMDYGSLNDFYILDENEMNSYLTYFSYVYKIIKNKCSIRFFRKSVKIWEQLKEGFMIWGLVKKRRIWCSSELDLPWTHEKIISEN